MKLSTLEKQRIKLRYGPWALVTGASSGIGLELAELLASSGLHIILHGRRAIELEKIAQRLQSKYGIETDVIAADISSEEGTQAIIQFTNTRKIALFVGSAGFGTSGRFLESNLEDEINMLKVNCEALLVLTWHFSKRFKEQKRGGIILLSSMVGFQGVPYAAHYAATKAYVQSFGEALAIELKPSGVDVLTAAPGPVQSGFGKRANMRMNMYLTPQQVGIPILKALGRQATVLPGTLTKFLVGSLRTVPRWGKVRIMEKVMRGMTTV